MNDVKQQVLDEIRSKVDVFKKSSAYEYRIRCPICGDSQSNPRDAHCYIKCSYDPNEPLLYNCFKCNSGGRVNRWFLEKLHVREDVISLVDKQKFNRLPSIKTTNVEMLTGSPIMNSPQVRYLESRLGRGFTFDDYDRFKIVWDMKAVLPFISSERVKNTLPSNLSSISFVSDNKSMILCRTFIQDDPESQWRKIKLFPSQGKSFYTIKTTLDLFTQEPVIINIAEGIVDIISVYKNWGAENSVYIAALGSDYVSVVDYAIAKGIVGQNVTVRVYIDNGIDERSLRYALKKYKWIFGGIYIYRNIKSKDVGVSIDEIQLVERRV